jgi:hypothetical protein
MIKLNFSNFPSLFSLTLLLHVRGAGSSATLSGLIGCWRFVKIWMYLDAIYCIDIFKFRQIVDFFLGMDGVFNFMDLPWVKISGTWIVWALSLCVPIEQLYSRKQCTNITGQISVRCVVYVLQHSLILFFLFVCSEWQHVRANKFSQLGNQGS